jgi:hypothetical protein
MLGLILGGRRRCTYSAVISSQGSPMTLPTATSGGRKNARDVAAGWTFIGDQSRLGLDRVDPKYLFHSGLAVWARWGALSFFQLGHERAPLPTT